MPIKTKLKDLRPSRERYARLIRLLSGGKINGAQFPDGAITVYPWDNQIDDWIQNRLQKGALRGRTLLFNVLPRVCNLNGCRLEDFVSSEVMGILMISRSILRNDQVIFETECPFCSDKRQNQLKIPDQLERVGEKKADWLGFDVITLPECQDVVKVRPVTVGEEMALIERTDAVRAQTCNDTVARIIAGLVSINDSKHDNALEAITWFKALPPSDSDFLIEEFDKTQPQLSNIVHVQCDECGRSFDHGLRLNDDFFRRVGPASDRGKVADAVRVSVQDQGSGGGPNKAA
jgi:hypothetical protein